MLSRGRPCQLQRFVAGKERPVAHQCRKHRRAVPVCVGLIRELKGRGTTHGLEVGGQGRHLEDVGKQQPVRGDQVDGRQDGDRREQRARALGRSLETDGPQRPSGGDRSTQDTRDVVAAGNPEAGEQRQVLRQRRGREPAEFPERPHEEHGRGHGHRQAKPVVSRAPGAEGPQHAGDNQQRSQLANVVAVLMPAMALFSQAAAGLLFGVQENARCHLQRGEVGTLDRRARVPELLAIDIRYHRQQFRRGVGEACDAANRAQDQGAPLPQRRRRHQRQHPDHGHRHGQNVRAAVVDHHRDGDAGQ